ncbi:MAG: CBS domain-containing protein [Candidatus Binatia bacterium]
MPEQIEEYLIALDEREQTPGRTLDSRTIREPIRRLNPRSPLCVMPSTPLREAIAMMREHHIGCVLVVEGEQLVGILTERDLLLKVESADLAKPVAECMTAAPATLQLDDPIVWALNRMSVGGYRHVPLVDHAGKPVGIVSVKDIVHYIVAFFPNEVLTLPPDPVRADVWQERDGA